MGRTDHKGKHFKKEPETREEFETPDMPQSSDRPRRMVGFKRLGFQALPEFSGFAALLRSRTSRFGHERARGVVGRAHHVRESVAVRRHMAGYSHPAAVARAPSHCRGS